MCGLAALIALERAALPPIQPMLDVIRHRGPDDEGWAAFAGEALRTVCGSGPDTPAACHGMPLPHAPTVDAVLPEDTRVCLGHRRLSILDVSPAGHQPMSYEDGRFWIVFNGEIYNHPKLRQELESLGHHFFSRSDTEVLLAAYAQWGESCLGRLEGMFAFVLLDRTTKTVLAARDRFGIKPLYYWISPAGILAFASEIKQFSTLPGWRAAINGQRVYDFLAWGLIDHTEETLFHGVRQVQPGAAVHLDLRDPGASGHCSRLTTFRWYRLEPRPFQGTFDEAAQAFRDRFTAVVQAHLRADVPVGSCLSGGLDSSSIVCVVNGFLREEGVRELQHAFSACSPIARFDEREYIDVVLAQTGVEGHCVYPDPDRLFRELERITWHQDEPFGSTSIFAQWSVFALAAQHGVKVMLDGQGADEQLAGYRGFHGALYASLFCRLRWLELFRELRAAGKTQGISPWWALKYVADAVLPDVLRLPLRALFGQVSARPDWLNLERLGAVPHDPFRREGPATSVGELSRRQLTATNLQMLLHWEDRDSMAHSIEARVPFLDHALVEFVLGLPDSFKLYRGVTKRVLREGMRGILPEAIRTRMSKLGFATPEEHWLRYQSPEKFRAALRRAVERSEGILTERSMDILNDMISGRRDFSFLPWRMISFGAWIERFGVKAA